jgi:cobalt-zinc-cadmium efflux system membrane fusion protein
MTRKTTVLLVFVLLGCLALGAGSLRHFGQPYAETKTEARDEHRHDGHDHAEKPETPGHPEEHQEHPEHKEDSKDAHGHEGHEHGAHEHEEDHVVRLSEARQRELGIEVAVAEPGSLKNQLALSGTIALNTDRLVHLVPRIPGIVRDVRKNLGDAVRAGEVVAVLDSRELAEAKAAYLAAGERLTLAADTFQREKDLWEKKISPAEDYINAKQALAEARIERRLAKQMLLALGFSESALKRLATQPDTSFTRYEVTAPVSGTVIEKHLTVGETVKDDSEAFSIADLEMVWVNLNVSPSDLPLVKKGQPVRIAAGPGLPEAEGKVSYIGATVSEETRTALVRVELPNPDGSFRPGLFVTATLAAGEAAAAVLIPQSAIQTLEGKSSVFVRTPEGFAPRAITLGQANDTHVEVTGGLAAGERYAVTETFLLKADLAKSEAGHQH